MKFHDLSIGTRFKFEGVEYIKTSPVLATSTEGKQRLIRRSAILSPVDSTDPQQNSLAEKSVPLDRAKTLQAFDAFYQACIHLAGNHPALEAARLTFLRELE